MSDFDFEAIDNASFEKLLSQIRQAGTERRKAICLAFRASLNDLHESRSLSRLNAFTSSVADSPEWARIRKAVIYLSGGMRLETGARPSWIQSPDKSLLRYDSKNRLWTEVPTDESHRQTTLAIWRDLRHLDYDAINPRVPEKALNLSSLKTAYTTLRNNPQRWDATQRIQIRKALDALAPIFED